MKKILLIWLLVYGVGCMLYGQVDPYALRQEALRDFDQGKAADAQKKLIKAYHAVLPYQPRNWVLLNNLAWHLCITKQDLKQAEQLSRATIMAQPNNPIYLDTYAWILFQLGQYNDALFYIQQAIDNIDIKTKNIDIEAETNDLDPETYKEIQHHYKAILKKAKK